MVNKVTIDGKEYTERVISSMDIDGVKTIQHIIPPQAAKADASANVTINLEGDKVEQSSLLQTQSIENKEEISALKLGENKEDKSWIKKIFDSIKKLFA
ncbi:hypothetical protein CHF27_008735 [Romboutsia maritimum]|uniref:Uncharacterized protein n=1 Tax=Romboutsia maritimum TaxID=2020948 RepID=A0A371IS88_9FIRM|nr:hypothetical protein [Romboutsia maritimum]RDY23323.1 hypothetical protein CHF27_008735 [Romboutsia maritimum]